MYILTISYLETLKTDITIQTYQFTGSNEAEQAAREARATLRKARDLGIITAYRTRTEDISYYDPWTVDNFSLDLNETFLYLAQCEADRKEHLADKIRKIF